MYLNILIGYFITNLLFPWGKFYFIWFKCGYWSKNRTLTIGSRFILLKVTDDGFCSAKENQFVIILTYLKFSSVDFPRYVAEQPFILPKRLNVWLKDRIWDIWIFRIHISFCEINLSGLRSLKSKLMISHIISNIPWRPMSKILNLGSLSLPNQGIDLSDFVNKLCSPYAFWKYNTFGHFVSVLSGHDNKNYDILNTYVPFFV